MSAICLGIHARYQCRHSGACCRNWTVPAEPQVVRIVETRKLRRAGFSGTLFTHAQGAVAVARDEDNDCVFYDRGDGGLCVIHRDAGVDALPAACRHFPRKILRDRRGVLVSLSHYCPTAARMLLCGRDLTLVAAGPSLELRPPLDAFEAAEALPPLLRPGLLCDMEGYRAWEEAGIATFARDDLRAGECLDVIAAATETVRPWTPGDERLASRVASAFRRAPSRAAGDADAYRRAIETVASLAAGRAGEFVPIDDFDRRWQMCVGDRTPGVGAFLKNYLAARLFANWIAYQGRGLRSIVAWLRTCDAVVRHNLLERARRSGAPPLEEDMIQSVRSADLLLLHVIDTAAFATEVALLEGPEPR
jgi:Fe-S-cluster containining protein